MALSCPDAEALSDLQDLAFRDDAAILKIPRRVYRNSYPDHHVDQQEEGYQEEY
jgi:hypothetical protein